MASIEKTVFISYRRTDVYTALAVYENLKNRGYDVFFDYRSISSGDFEQIIISNIRARAHFLLILTPTALDRCNEPDDWLRREIEFAIDEKRNIVPLFFRGFRFGDSPVTAKLTGKMLNIRRYNGLNVHEDYFDEAMHRLRTQYLNIPLNTVLHPVSTDVRKVVREEKNAADKALEQIENVQELVKQDSIKPAQPNVAPTPWENKATRSVSGLTPQGKKAADIPVYRVTKPLNVPDLNFRLFGGLIAGVSLLALLIWGGVNIFKNQLSNTPASTLSSQAAETQTPRPRESSTALPIRTSTPVSTESSQPVEVIIPSPTPTLGIGSAMTGKDGMTLLYVPAGEFTMGSDVGYPDQRPAHTVYLDAFWIDKTEVTNKMYALCVAADLCKEPDYKKSYTRSSYYGNSDFDTYPVIYMGWDMANTYCKWAGRRLPTEAEWEKAALGTDQRVYPWGNSIDCSLANYSDYSNGYCVGDTTEVGKYPSGASPYGALDMTGNVLEWVADWYSASYYSNSPSSNPSGPISGQNHVLRGGSWYLYGVYIEPEYRGWYYPIHRYDYFGFRCAMSASP